MIGLLPEASFFSLGEISVGSCGQKLLFLKSNQMPQGVILSPLIQSIYGVTRSLCKESWGAVLSICWGHPTVCLYLIQFGQCGSGPQSISSWGWGLDQRQLVEAQITQDQSDNGGLGKQTIAGRGTIRPFNLGNVSDIGHHSSQARDDSRPPAAVR